MDQLLFMTCIFKIQEKRKKDEIEATELVEFVNNVDGNKISKQEEPVGYS